MISRRNFVKMLVAASTFFVVTPFSTLEKFFRVPAAGAVKLKRTLIANKNEIQPGESKMFSYPKEDRPAMLIHLKPGTYEVGNFWDKTETVTLNKDDFRAYDTICTHLGCPAGWIIGEQLMGPSCHGARFSPINGSVRAGPPRRVLPKIKLEIDDDGNIYANGYESGLPLYGWENITLEQE